VILAERKSRQRAEVLAQEVETLAARLERTRIAREIHDSLGHTLTTLDVQLEVAQKLRQRDPEQALQAVDTAKKLASQCLEDVRAALSTIRNNDFNLQQALYELIAQVKQHQTLDIVVELHLPTLPLQTSHQLYCIVQEGLMNVQKHAQAKTVWLRGWMADESLTLELEDDGQGFDPGQSRSGFGLRGIEERVQLLGGKLKVSTVAAQGTQIQVTIPRSSRCR
jgi:signal transduction histidine kinase